MVHLSRIPILHDHFSWLSMPSTSPIIGILTPALNDGYKYWHYMLGIEGCTRYYHIEYWYLFRRLPSLRVLATFANPTCQSF